MQYKTKQPKEAKNGFKTIEDLILSDIWGPLSVAKEMRYSIYNIREYYYVIDLLKLPYVADGISCLFVIQFSFSLLYFNSTISFHRLCNFQVFWLSNCGIGKLYISGKECYVSALIWQFFFYSNCIGTYKINVCL